MKTPASRRMSLARFGATVGAGAIGLMLLALARIFSHPVEVFSVGACVLGVAMPVAAWGWTRRWWLRGLAVLLGAAPAYVGAILFSYRGELLRYPIVGISRAQLKSIDWNIREFERQHGHFPDSLAQLVDEGGFDIRNMYSPFHSRNLPDAEQRIDYAYVPELTRDDPDWWPIAFDREDIHADGLRAVLLLSGQTRVYRRQSFVDLMTRFQADFVRLRGHEPTIVLEDPPAAAN